MEALFTTLTTVLSAVITYWLTRKKYQTEVERARADLNNAELCNVDKAVTIWRQLSDDIKKRLEADIALLRSENLKITDRLIYLTRDNATLQRQIDTLNKELRATRAENEKLRKELNKLAKASADANME